MFDYLLHFIIPLSLNHLCFKPSLTFFIIHVFSTSLKIIIFPHCVPSFSPSSPFPLFVTLFSLRPFLPFLVSLSFVTLFPVFCVFPPHLPFICYSSSLPTFLPYSSSLSSLICYSSFLAYSLGPISQTPPVAFLPSHPPTPIHFPSIYLRPGCITTSLGLPAFLTSLLDFFYFLAFLFFPPPPFFWQLLLFSSILVHFLFVCFPSRLRFVFASYHPVICFFSSHQSDLSLLFFFSLCLLYLLLLLHLRLFCFFPVILLCIFHLFSPYFLSVSSSLFVSSYLSLFFSLLSFSY